MTTPEAFEEFGALYVRLFQRIQLGRQGGRCRRQIGPRRAAESGGRRRGASGSNGRRRGGAAHERASPRRSRPARAGHRGRPHHRRAGEHHRGRRLIVQVCGTTLAGDADDFDIEVVKNGLFSQEVPTACGPYTGSSRRNTTATSFDCRSTLRTSARLARPRARKRRRQELRLEDRGAQAQGDKSLPSSYYGGSVDLMDSRQYHEARRLAHRHPGEDVITLTRGPLLDGSRASR